MKFSHLSRVYITESLIEDQIILISGDDFHYLKSVMRLRIDESFRAFNENDGEYLVQIIEIVRSSLKVIVKKRLRVIIEEKKLTLAISIIKPDRIIEAIKAAVQLGVTGIIPIISERTQYKKISRDRAEKCIIQATQQSERLKLPELLPEISLLEFIKANDYEQIIVASENENITSKISNIKNIGDNPVVIIGPEGGFSGVEIEMMKSYIQVSLGNTVLRSEVAAIAALACISMIRG